MQPISNEPRQPDPVDPDNPAPAPLQASPTLFELAFGVSATDAGTPDGRSRPAHAFGNLRINLDDPAQRILGDYELLERIGEGGMGLVYRARQTSLDREVAIKLLAAGPWASSEFIERFRREAQHSARMEHPNIVTVYDVGTIEQLHYFSMRLVRGETLALRLHRNGVFDPREAARLMRTVAEAVDYAHSLNVLHLDLKPGNILIDSANAPHVADFGLARRLDRMLALDTLEVAGTPSYMAPEQTRTHQGRLSPATDIWSLGAICHELVTGRPPFHSDSAQATLALVRKGRIRRLRRSHPHVPADFEAIVLKCLAKQPDRRYQSARALADDLGRFLNNREVRARPLNPFQRWPHWARREPKLAITVALALLALLLSLGATTQQWRRADANARSAARNAATARERLWDMRDQAALRLAETGEGWLATPDLLANLREQLAHDAPQRADEARERLGVLENNNPQLIDLVPQAPASALAFSQDGRRLALATQGRQLRLVDTGNGAQLWQAPLPATLLPDDDGSSSVSSLHFSADGRRLVASVAATQATILPDRLLTLLFSADDGRRIEPPAAFGRISEAIYSANGLFALLTNSSGVSQMWATQPWRPVGARRRLPPTLLARAQPRLVAGNGRFLLSTLPSGTPVLFDADTLAARNVSGLDTFGQTTAWTLSRDARWLAVGDAEGRVRLIDCVDDSARALAPQSPQGVRWLAFSADGAWLAAAAGEAGVFLWDWPQGRLLAAPFGADPAVDQVEVDRLHARVLTSSYPNNGHGSGAVWEIAPARFDNDRTAAVQLGERFGLSGSRRSSALAWQPEAGLLATVRSDDHDKGTLSPSTAVLRLERLPATVLKSVRAAPIKPGVLRFDGHRLVAVDARHIQIVDAISETPLSASIDLAQAPGFAELSPSGDALVVSSGRSVHVYNARSGKERLATPIVLPNSPQRIAIRPDGRLLLTTCLEHNADGVSEVAELWDLATGRRQAGPLNLPGPLEGLRYSSDGRRLLAWDQGTLSVRDGATLAAVTGPIMASSMRAHVGPAVRATWTAATFAASGAILAVLDETDRDGHSHGHLLDLVGQQARRIRNVRPTVVDLLPLPGSDRVLAVSARDGIDVVEAGGNNRALPSQSDLLSAHGIAVSADGRWIARALRNGVELHAADSPIRIVRLQAALPLPDQLWQLAFSPDGTRLLGRSVRNRYVVWNLAPDTRSPDAIERALALHGVPGLQSHAGGALDAAERAALRAADPGPPTAPQHTATLAVHPQPAGDIPARAADTPAAALDLGRWYNVALDGVDRSSGQTAGDFSWLPQGVQRLLGVDYDLRGLIQLHDAAAPYSAQLPTPQQVRVELPSPKRVSALDVLMLAQLQTAPGKAASAIDMVYGNGQRVRLPIVAGQQVHAYWRTDIGDRARLAAYGWDARALQAHTAPTHVYAIRLPNPHPQWPLKALELMALPGMGAAPAFLALTTEPATAPE